MKILRTGLTALLLGCSSEPQTIVHLKWMHYIPGDNQEQIESSRTSNLQLQTKYNYLITELGRGPVYLDGREDSTKLELEIETHKRMHQTSTHAEEDRNATTNGPIYADILEGRITARPLEMRAYEKAYIDSIIAHPEKIDTTITNLTQHPIFLKALELREDGMLKRLSIERPRVAYLLLGCAHNLTRAVKQSNTRYRLIVVSTPIADTAAMCNPT